MEDSGPQNTIKIIRPYHVTAAYYNAITDWGTFIAHLKKVEGSLSYSLGLLWTLEFSVRTRDASQKPSTVYSIINMTNFHTAGQRSNSDALYSGGSRIFWCGG